MTLGLSQEVMREYDRWEKILGTDDPYKSEKTLGMLDVLRAHFLIADFFSAKDDRILALGPRDKNLLHSALDRQHVGYGGNKKWITKHDVAATLFYGLIKDHPFHDANKRTALLSLLYHLSLYGLIPTCKEVCLETLAVRVAEGGLRGYKYKVYEKLQGDPDRDVKIIAYFLRHNTRASDKKYYAITYRQLKTILNRFGYDLSNPSGGTIDVLKIKEKPLIMGFFGKLVTAGDKVAQIGFPGWTKQVGKGAIKTVRQETGLIPENGCDSAVFFKDQDDISKLMVRYQDPLINLARK